jgi:hypothetical protein
MDMRIRKENKKLFIRAIQTLKKPRSPRFTKIYLKYHYSLIPEHRIDSQVDLAVKTIETEPKLEQLLDEIDKDLKNLDEIQERLSRNGTEYLRLMNTIVRGRELAERTGLSQDTISDTRHHGRPPTVNALKIMVETGLKNKPNI